MILKSLITTDDLVSHSGGVGPVNGALGRASASGYSKALDIIVVMSLP